MCGRRWRCGAVAVATLGLVCGVVKVCHNHVVATAVAYGAVNQASYFYAFQAVLEGRGQEPRFPFDGPTKSDDELQAMWFSVLGIFGKIFLHPMRLSVDLTGLAIPWGPGDAKRPGARFCRDVLGYMWAHPDTYGFSYPAIYADSDQVKLWVEACQEVYPELGAEERGLLQPHFQANSIPLEILVSSPPNYTVEMAAGRAAGPVEEESRQLTREEVRDIFSASVAASRWRDFPDVNTSILESYISSLNFRAPNGLASPTTWADVGEAIRKGRITQFDATPLLPAELFNVSYETMVRWEGPAAANRIPIWGDSVTPTSLAAWTQNKVAALKQHGVRTTITLAEPSAIVNFAGDPVLRSKLVSLTPQQDDQLRGWYITDFMVKPGHSGYVHTRRLPEFHKKLPVAEDLMNIGEDVLRAQSMLWLGPTPGGFHFDEEANVYIQLTGESFALLGPQNFTSAMTGADRHPWGGMLPHPSEVAADPYLKEVPLYLVHLRPGRGITLQGRTYHKFICQTRDRVALNWFFIPRWRRMEYTKADWYAVEAASSLPRLALRQLWARTLTRLYEKTGQGIVFMGLKLEYI